MSRTTGECLLPTLGGPGANKDYEEYEEREGGYEWGNRPRTSTCTSSSS